jgi:basic membrane protein A and related proteins
MAVQRRVLCLATLSAVAAAVSPVAVRAAAPRIIFVTAEGGLGDHSFNDMIAAGLDRAKASLGIDYVVIQPRAVSEFQSSLIRAASFRPALVLGASFDMITPIKAAAAAFPRQKFAIIDVGSDPIAPNVLGAVAKDWEGSYLAGVAAAMTSKTGTIGFVGGKDIPVIHRFFYGYYYGAKLVRPHIKIIESYTGSFTDPAAGKEYALAAINQGADVTFAVANLTGAGVIDAALSTKTFAIGVDSDQNCMAPGTVLTSMMKRVDNIAFNIVKSVQDGSFKGGIIKQYGLAQDGVQLAMDHCNRGLMSAATLAKIDEMRNKVVSGSIQVPNYIELDAHATKMGNPPIDRPPSSR